MEDENKNVSQSKTNLKEDDETVKAKSEHKQERISN